MVAIDEIILESKLGGKSTGRRGTSVASASVVKFTDQESMTTDQKFGSAGDLLPGTPIHRHRYSRSKESGLRQEPKSRLSEGAAYRGTSYTSNGTTQTRTANAQNQITSISGTVGTLTYDANGNMTTDQTGNTYTYNAWDQLVSVKNSSGQLIAQYSYNAMRYRITESYPQGGTGIPAGEINYIYYDSSWQAIETRTGGTANSNVTSQTVWSAAYINAAILQDTYSAGVIQPNSRIYYLQDANWNTMAVVGFNSTSRTWGVTQRYTYSPYGTITILNADWSTPASGTLPAVDNLYQGMTLDSVTGLYYARNRNYSPSLGRWINQDAAGYINGANTYQFVMGGPVNTTDPWGMWAWGWVIWTGEAIAHPYNTLYTGNPEATQAEYNAAVGGAGEWHYNNSPVRGFYGNVGFEGEGPENNGIAAGSGGGFYGDWTMDNGFGGGAQFNFGGEWHNGNWAGGGGYFGYQQGKGWSGGDFIGGGHGDSEVGTSYGLWELGIGTPYTGGGLLIDPSKFGNLAAWYLKALRG